MPIFSDDWLILRRRLYYLPLRIHLIAPVSRKTSPSIGPFDSLGPLKLLLIDARLLFPSCSISQPSPAPSNFESPYLVL